MLSKQQIGERLADIYGLSGKTAIITGAGSGLGRATAKLFAAVGARVMVADINEEAAKESVRQIEAAGGDADWALADISDESAVRGLFEKTGVRFGGVDILVNNAAYRSKAEFFEMSVEEWDKMHEITTRGTFLCSREAIKMMKEAGNGGAIVNISSMSATHTNLWGINYHYDSAKSGVDALTRGLAGEFAADNIRVNSIQPGGMKSEGGANISKSFNIRGPVAGPGRMLMGVAEPLKVAQAVLFIASPAASFVTGQVLAVEGGFLVS